MHMTNDPAVVRRYSIISLIAVAIIDDGVSELANYMKEAGYPEEFGELQSIVGVALSDDEPKVVVTFTYLGDDGLSFDEGTFYIWINDDETVGGDY